MAYNKTLKVRTLSKIDKRLIRKAIFLAYRDGVSTVAPLGFSGDTILLFGNEEGGRKSVVSIRNYSGDAELLITDLKGNFLFYGRFDVNLGLEFLVDRYYDIIQMMKPHIRTILPVVSDDIQKVNFEGITEKTTLLQGFKMLVKSQKSKQLQTGN